MRGATNKVVVMAAVAISAAACQDTAPRTKSEKPECADALDNGFRVSKASMSKLPGMTDKTLAAIRQVSWVQCAKDRWADDVLSCMTVAKTEPDFITCHNKLTQTQIDNLASATQAVLRSADDSQHK